MMTKKYAVVDLETSIKNRGDEAIGKMKAAPWHPLNQVVEIGAFVEGKEYIGPATKKYPEEHHYHVKDIDLLIGHNIKFDCHYMMRDSKEFRREFIGIQIWDTQLAEYLLSGQTLLYPSLDECSYKYGGTIKDDRIKDFWNNDIDTEDIPPEMLTEYLKHDVNNTHLVFKAQLQKAEKMGMLPLIISQMKALKATIEMEYNGMHFDVNKAEELAAPLKEQLTHLEADIYSAMTTSNIRDANPASNQHIGLLLFGGDQKIQVDTYVLDEDGNKIKYKSGKKKGEYRTRKVDTTLPITGIFHGRGDKTASGKWKVDDDSLTKWEKHTIVNAIKTMRTLTKDISTYYEGYSKLTWPDGIIHHSLNHCATGTGRLSSTNPNMQNASNND